MHLNNNSEINFAPRICSVLLTSFKLTLSSAYPERSKGMGEGSGPPGNHKAIVVRIPWKNTKIPNKHSMGHHRHAIRWRADDGPLR